MTSPGPDSSRPSNETTFSSYNQTQGKIYALNRRNYHPSVYHTILDRHVSTGGQFGTLLDVGCGPGTATVRLAREFLHAIGLDPSEGMIATARSLECITSMSEPVRFEISTAEDLGSTLSPPVGDSSVDLIVAANAAHWFDIPRFWERAGRMLKPGGTVALWTSGEIRIHPSMPNAVAIQAAMDEIEEQELKPFFLPGNLLTRDCYTSLPLPWDLDQPIPCFDRSSFFRKDWGLSDSFFLGNSEVDLDTFEKMMATASPVVRWRQAHPADAGTERDVLKMFRGQIERLLREAGVQQGKEMVKGTARGALIMVKKSIGI
ncbi:hypothetical protein P175DRAFT_0502558 [Aspergillus ochraceoroseus IBT 24754]|uniref:Methyltransferase type 11 domain-containing protein n=2 Tax=Aspergillus ochraceoroseus TaxID=138278 RepID=A0A2T5LVY1_9EURO|nr:uncharacterized protein P175DRAFT_0502558 [Aspergillus ochraceoroseus IBT 24754]KKK24811.1 hypothetical protein AOCH_000253 [Aspergillus ochraceoroseus]PTU20429.1 hypothetical protein P175DRAFT_0502558 [Aspergillus ochraceoroseus IBT 24754]